MTNLKFIFWLSNILLAQAFNMPFQLRGNILRHQLAQNVSPSNRQGSFDLISKRQSRICSVPSLSMSASSLSDKKEHETDFVVVGSGLGGLSAAALLVMDYILF